MLEPRSSAKPGDVIGLLVNLREAVGERAPAWSIPLTLKDKTKTHVVMMAIEAFLTTGEYRRSLMEPVHFADLDEVRAAKARWTQAEPHTGTSDPERFWLFRDAIYSTERAPGLLEIDEVILRIKAMQYKEAETVRRLREQVANFEAVEKNLSEPSIRRTLPDDVRLLVWTRDGGVCVRCGAASDLQFDHIIPFSRGGGDQAENIQLLCRPCNLAKSDRLF